MTEELVPDPFLHISLDPQSEILYSWFLLYDQAQVYQNILKLNCWSSLHFLHDFRLKIFLYPVCDIINFETKLSFHIKPFPYIQKVSTEIQIPWEQKVFLTWNKRFSWFLKGLQLSKNVIDSKVGLKLCKSSIWKRHQQKKFYYN